jgi:hypothetical protein
MSEKTFRTILFVALLLVAPALIFLVQVVFIVPPVFLLAGVTYVLKKTVVSGFHLENLAFIGFFLAHLLVFGGLYWLLALILGKMAKLLPGATPRVVLLVALLGGLAWLTQQPIYGGGGTARPEWAPFSFCWSNSAKTMAAPRWRSST